MWRAFGMPLINCEINLILTWFDNWVISFAIGGTKFIITERKFYVSLETVSTQDNAKLFEQLKSGFKIKINCNKYQSKVSLQAPNPYLDYLIDPIIQVVNTLFVLSFENSTDTKVHAILSCKSRNKRLQCYYRLDKSFLINQ